MRYVMMHKADQNTENGVMPPQELIQGMGRLIGDMIKSGTFLDGGGLLASKKRVRVTCGGGKAAVTKGPYTGSNEVLAAFTGIKVKDMHEAIAWTKRIGAILGDVEFEIGPMTESWDLGGPRPEGFVPLRCLVLQKATRASEAGMPLPAPQKTAM